MPHVKGLVILDDCKENQKMTSKLPDWAVKRWSQIVAESLNDVTEYPTFKQFVAFVQGEARAACHPVASISAVKDAGSKAQHGEMSKARSLETDQSNENQFARSKYCSFCKGQHYLAQCKKFTERTLDERNTFLKNNRRCYGCLRAGHIVSQCKACHTCTKCGKRHPTVLHNDSIQQDTSHNVSEVSAAFLNADGGQSSTTNILPVWISTADNPRVEKLVYALLDTQSDSTFIEEKVCEELSASTDPVKLKLSTLLGKDVIVGCKRAKGLRIREYTSAQYTDLPSTYTRDFIPLNREHIPTCETAKNWSHLATIAAELPPLMDCEVPLLVGYNCPAALAPRQVITGDISQPYAVKTDLGWSIVGSLVADDSGDVTGFCHRVSYTS